MKTATKMIHNSDICIIYPKHNVMMLSSVLDNYNKFGIGSHLTFKHNTYDSLNKYFDFMHHIEHKQLIKSSKNFTFYYFDEFIMSSCKIAENLFLLNYNSDTYTSLHTFLTFLSYCI